MLEHVGLSKSVVFRTHHIYADDLIPKLADAAVVLASRSGTDDAVDANHFLRFFGRCFVRYFSHYGYEKFIKVGYIFIFKIVLQFARFNCYYFIILYLKYYKPKYF